MEQKDVTESSPRFQQQFTHCSLLPLKLHFILTFGACGVIIPILPVLGEQLGMSATAIGIMYAAHPIVILLSKPVLGAITDYTKNIKMVMIFHVILYGLFLAGILFIRPIPQPPPHHAISLTCFNNTSSISVSNRYNQSCVESHLNRNVTCEFRFDSCASSNLLGTNVTCNRTCDTFSKITIHFRESDFQTAIENFYSSVEFPDVSLRPTYENHSACDCGDSSWKSISCNANFNSCLLGDDSKEPIYKTYQFWAFALLVLVIVPTTGTMCTLCDIAACEILTGRMDLYGNQRLFGTLSWGILNFLAGYLNETFKIKYSNTDYEPSFFIAFSLLSLDLVLLSWMRLDKANYTPSVWKDIGRILTSAEILVFIVGLFIAGGVCGLIVNYELWYLQNLGASKFLMGIAILVQCLAAEAPFFYISKYFIRIFGNYYCLVLTFLGFCLRLVLYHYLVNPWLILPIDLLHGLTFSNLYANMISFGKRKAPPGTEATMLGLLAGVLEGLGFGAGGLLGGVGFDKIGDRLTFLSVGIFSGAFGIIFIIATLTLKHCESRRKTSVSSTKALCVLAE